MDVSILLPLVILSVGLATESFHNEWAHIQIRESGSGSGSLSGPVVCKTVLFKGRPNGSAA